MKTLNYIFGIIAASLALAGWAILNVLITPALGAWVAVFNVAYILAATIFVSHYFNLSIPGVRLLLRRAYYRAKFKAGGASGMKNAGPFRRFYVQFLVYLIWLFKETEEGFETVKDEAEHLYSSALLVASRGSGDKKPGKKELLHIHKRHQNRAAALSLTALFVLVIGTVITGLISSFLFPAVFQTQAATYIWEQVDWSGGATSSVAVHPDDTTGWTYYESKDDNVTIDGNGSITLDSTSQEIVDTTNGDFDAGSNSWMSSSDSISLAGGAIYDADEYGCGEFGVRGADLPNKHDWSEAKTACSDLCDNCELPSKTELKCICDNKSSLGSNYKAARYWSAAGSGTGNGVYVDFSDCDSDYIFDHKSYNVRCVRR